MSGGDDTVSARDALLVWSRRVVAGYPGICIKDFSHSWRDGLAFLAILHRHRSTTHSRTRMLTIALSL